MPSVAGTEYSEPTEQETVLISLTRLYKHSQGGEKNKNSVFNIQIEAERKGRLVFLSIHPMWFSSSSRVVKQRSDRRTQDSRSELLLQVEKRQQIQEVKGGRVADCPAAAAAAHRNKETHSGPPRQETWTVAKHIRVQMGRGLLPLPPDVPLRSIEFVHV